MTLATVSLRLYQDSAASRTRIIDSLFGHFVTGDDIVAVDNVAGNAKARGFLGEVAYGGLHIRGRRVRVLVVLSDDDQREALHRREVYALKKCSGAGPTIADVCKANDVFLLHARGQQNSCHHRNHVAEM